MPKQDRPQFNLSELSGSLADLGVLMPIAVSLIMLNKLNPTAVFLGVGLLYFLGGWYFRIPVPVQPLKAMAVIALTIGASPALIAAAGMEMGLFLLLLSLTGLIDRIAAWFSRPIIRGIQLSVGVLLVKKGLNLILAPSGNNPGSWISLSGALVTLVLLIAWGENRRFPAVLAALLLGGLFGVLGPGAGLIKHAQTGWVPLTPVLPSMNDFLTGFWLLLIPQIPLTLGNAVVATADTARQYFGDRAEKVTPKGLSVSLGAANLIIGFFGGMPACHGSGGLTAHYRFGARTGGSGIILGTVLITLALVFGEGSLAILNLIPPAVLGMLLMIVGIEHAALISDMAGSRAQMVVALIVASLSLATGNLAVGFLAGLACDLLKERSSRLAAFIENP
ncbi:MAG: putative sulfate/molybdate transporter [bacterium]